MAKEGLLKFTKSDKKSEKGVEVKSLTPEEERDLKAKEKANILMQDVKLPKIGEHVNNDLFEIDDRPNTVSTDWLTEQVALLTEENEKLRKEAEVAKEDYTKIFTEYQRIKTISPSSDSDIKVKIIELFDELQDNFIRMGVNPHTGRENFVVRFPAFLQRIILFFPFLESRRKYKV